MAALLGWCLFLFWYGLSAGTLYRTEALRAIIGQSALDGHWLVPTLYGEPFLTKPPGMYVAIALCSLPFRRVTEVSARLPSAIAATVMILVFACFLRRSVGSTRAFVIALLLPVALVWLDKAPSADIDMLLVMWVTLALLFFERATENDSKGLAWWCAALLCVTLGFLTKWTAPAFFYVTIIPLLAWRRQLSQLWSWRHLIAVSAGCLLVSAWACAVAAQTGWELLFNTFLREAQQRFEPGHHGRAYPWKESLSFPFVVVASLLPWSILALFTLRQSVLRQWDDRARRLIQLCHCWTWPNLIFWSLPGQHAVRYALPVAPGLITLGIIGLLSLPRSDRNRVMAGLLIIWVVVKVVFVEVVVPQRTAHTHVRETAQTLRALIPEGHILYLCRLKDEGVLFYYGRAARRLPFPDSPGVPYYALLLEDEWNDRHKWGNVDAIRWLQDQQGASVVLVKVHPHEGSKPNGDTSRNSAPGRQ